MKKMSEKNLWQDSLFGEKDVRENRRVDESLSGESNAEEKVQGEKQDLEDKILSGEFRWISRAHKTDPEEKMCSVTGSSVDNKSSNSGIDIYSDRNLSTGLELSRARDTSERSGQRGISRP